MTRRMYRLTYDAGLAGITTWEKTMEELLTPNGSESLLDWMLRESDARGSQTFTLEYIGEESSSPEDAIAVLIKHGVHFGTAAAILNELAPLLKKKP